MAKKPDVMLSLPVDPVATASAYKSVTRAGTKLVLLSNVPKGFVQGRDYVTVVTDDLFQMGKHAADALAASIGGKGKIAYFFHDASYYVTNQRDQAFKKTIEANYPNIELVAEQGIADPNKAQEQANAILTKNPDLDGVYVTFSQPPAEGVLAALRNNGNTKTKLVSLDLDEPLTVDMARAATSPRSSPTRPTSSARRWRCPPPTGCSARRRRPFLVAPAITVTKDNLAAGLPGVAAPGAAAGRRSTRREVVGVSVPSSTSRLSARPPSGPTPRGRSGPGCAPGRPAHLRRLRRLPADPRVLRGRRSATTAS